MTERYNVGKIVNTHGLKGEVRIVSITDFPEERYRVGSGLVVELANSSELKRLTVASARRHKQFFLVKFAEYDDINSVEFLKGSMLQVESEHLISLDKNEFYYHEIVGCHVLGENEREIGVVTGIYNTSANDVWIVQTDEKKEVLIPYIEDVVKKIDINNGKIWIEEMEGML